MNVSRAEQQVISFPASINKFLISNSYKKSEQAGKGKSILKRKKNDVFTSGARDQSTSKPKLTEIVKRKLSLGARILQVGGLDKIYRRLFRVSEDEKLFKTYQCYLSTTGGPIAGILFISSKKMAFCSERSVKVASPQGGMTRIHYKVSIPLCKIQRVNQSQNTKKPSQKYLEVVTVDGFDFWFMGFLSNKKAFSCLEKALSLSFGDSEEQ
ncbi:GEM-like protein 4 [Hirschfeldia incana]|nr:GEM-like protein 4 [Hirschfeldia incana]